MMWDCWVLIIFDTNIFETSGHQMTVQVPTSPYVCSCTTWGNDYNYAHFSYTAIYGFTASYCDLWLHWGCMLSQTAGASALG